MASMTRNPELDMDLVREAQRAIAGRIRETPVEESPALSELAGAPVFLKLECLQLTGSFKLRGAVRAIAALPTAARAAGVVAASAGNHGAGLAAAAAAAGVRVHVVVPASAPAIKRARIAALGATIEVGGDDYGAAEARARALAAQTGATFVSAFDDDQIIAGNGAELGAELARQCPELARVLCPVGGGGLVGGLAAELAPRGVTVIGVQPQVNCAMHESLRLGRALTDYRGGATLCEGLEGAVAERTYELCRRHVAEVALVAEADVRRAVAFLFRDAGVVAEPSAAVVAAALLTGAATPAPTGITVAVITGGNIDDALLDAILAG
ncbi:MAG TPA: pyridoxal-phosphate dependent enzyme [Kofleriaceae bacterium]|nr:pyridoxal-phosphate dependent enzyme [Kofleriaceae bacterium]